MNYCLSPARVAYQAQEMLELSDSWRAEILYRDVVPPEAQSRGARDVVSRRLLVFLQERDQHLEAVAPQLFEVREGRIWASQQMRIVDPPSIHPMIPGSSA